MFSTHVLDIRAALKRYFSQKLVLGGDLEHNLTQSELLEEQDKKFHPRLSGVQPPHSPGKLYTQTHRFAPTYLNGYHRSKSRKGQEVKTGAILLQDLFIIGYGLRFCAFNDGFFLQKYSI